MFQIWLILQPKKCMSYCAWHSLKLQNNVNDTHVSTHRLIPSLISPASASPANLQVYICLGGTPSHCLPLPCSIREYLSLEWWFNYWKLSKGSARNVSDKKTHPSVTTAKLYSDPSLCSLSHWWKLSRTPGNVSALSTISYPAKQNK